RRHTRSKRDWSSDVCSSDLGTFTTKDFLVLEAIDQDGTVGWGESVAFHSPWYNEETLQTNWHMLEDFLIPLILNKEIKHPDEVRSEERRVGKECRGRRRRAQ